MFLPEPSPGRQKLIAQIVCVLLVVGAALIVLLATAIPLPIRLLVAATDLVAAAAIWLLARQKFGR